MATMAYQGWAIWDSVAAVELLNKLDEPRRTTLQQDIGCQPQWVELRDEGIALNSKLVRLNNDPVVAGRRIGKEWAGGVAMPPEFSLRLANWTNAWRYFKTTDCVDAVGLYTAQSQGFSVRKRSASPSSVRTVAVDVELDPEVGYTSPVRASVTKRRTNPATSAPAPDFVTPPEDDEYVWEDPEPEGLSTGAKLGLAAGAIAVVSGLLWATTRKRR